MALWKFPSGTPIDLDVAITSGTISITGEQTDTVTVRTDQAGPGGSADSGDDLSVQFSDGRLEVTDTGGRGLRLRRGDVGIVIAVPAGSRCAVRASVADVGCQGELGALDVRTSAGSVSAATVTGPVQINTLAGDVRLDDAGAEAAVNTASGMIHLRRVAGDVTATSASGDVWIGTAGRSASVRTSTGRVRIGSVARGQVHVTSASGDVQVRVAPGAGVYLDLTSVVGRVSSDLQPTAEDGPADLRLTCRTVSGSLHVARAEYASVG